MGKPTGFIGVHRKKHPTRPVAERVKDWREVYLPYPAGVLEAQGSRCMDSGIPFCHQGCPLGNPIPDWNDLVYRNRWDAAIERLRRAVAARPGHAASHTALGTALRDRGDVDAAKSELERAVALDPNDLRAHYQLGLVYGKLGDKERAKQMLERAETLRGEQRERETVILKLVDPPQE